jgi:hypothetical protein
MSANQIASTQELEATRASTSGSKGTVAEQNENSAENPATEEVVEDILDADQERDRRIRAGILPLFLTSVTQGMFKIRSEDFPPVEEGAGTVMCFKMIPKADLLADIQARLVMSDFHPAKTQITV